MDIVPENKPALSIKAIQESIAAVEKHDCTNQFNSPLSMFRSRVIEAAKLWVDNCDALADFRKLETKTGLTVEEALKTIARHKYVVWQEMDTAPTGEKLFLCRKKSKPHVTFEACIFTEQESWEIPKEYFVVQDMTSDYPIEDDWRSLQWSELPEGEQE